MEFFDNILLGFSTLFVPSRLFFCFVGTLIGTIVGVLPGLGPAGAVSLLLPVTFTLDPTSGIIMLAGIYYGCMYGGSTTSILVNIPGEAASTVTCLDGYKMARQGRAGAALGISAFGSFIAGTVGVVGLMFLTPLLTRFAVAFGPPEYFALMFCGLSILIYLASGSVLKAVIMAAVGIFLGTVGLDITTGIPRFTYGSLTLFDGVGIVPVVMGLFGVAEVLDSVERPPRQEVLKADLSHLLPTRDDWKAAAGPILRGSVVGFFLGILPGGTATASTFASYALEKKLSKHPERFGQGTIEGVAAPEAANNAAVTGAFIPLISLGIPTNPVMAMLLGALIVGGVQPGPLFIKERPDIFWGVIASMYLGNLMLLVLNLPLIPLWVKILRIRMSVLAPLIVLFCMIGCLSLNGNYVEVLIMVLFGVLGFAFRKFEYEAAPLVFGMILSSPIENKLRQSLLLSEGSFDIFFTRPIALIFMVIGITLFLLPAVQYLRSRRRTA
jgi:putative tricarboxylic transport membrane protein